MLRAAAAAAPRSVYVCGNVVTSTGAYEIDMDRCTGWRVGCVCILSPRDGRASDPMKPRRITRACRFDGDAGVGRARRCGAGGGGARALRPGTCVRTDREPTSCRRTDGWTGLSTFPSRLIDNRACAALTSWTSSPAPTTPCWRPWSSSRSPSPSPASSPPSPHGPYTHIHTHTRPLPRARKEPHALPSIYLCTTHPTN